MANYYSMGRTNHFAVKDQLAFVAEITPIIGEDDEIVREEKDGVDGFVLLFPDGVPSEYYDYGYPEDYDVEPIQLDWVDIISKHLPDGEVCIIQEIGYEKLRYLTGYSVAFNNKGEQEHTNINSIYDQAKELGTRITMAEY